MFSNQATFDLVLNAIRSQGKPSVAKIGRLEGPAFLRCCYRGEDGAKCAAGCLIPDDLYSDDLELSNADDKKVSNILIGSGFEPTFVRKLQCVHDAAARDGDCLKINPNFLRDFEGGMKILAVNHSLQYMEPQSC